MAEINFFWDPIEDNIVQERDETAAVVADYTTEPCLYGDLVSQRRSDQSSFYCFDGQGSTLALTDAAGNVTDTYAYSAFGEVTEQTGSTLNPFQYVGQKGYYKDNLTLEYVARRRPLSARGGRWLAFECFVYLWLQQYKYCDQQPTTYTDPSGCEFIPLPDRPTPRIDDTLVPGPLNAPHIVGNFWLWSRAFGDPPLVVQHVTVKGILQCTLSLGCPPQELRYRYSWYDIWNLNFVGAGEDEKRKDKHRSSVNKHWDIVQSTCAFNCDPCLPWGWLQQVEFRVTNVPVTRELAELGTSWFHKTEVSATADVQCVNVGTCPCVAEPAIPVNDFHPMYPVGGRGFQPTHRLDRLFILEGGPKVLACNDEWSASNDCDGRKVRYRLRYSTSGYR